MFCPLLRPPGSSFPSIAERWICTPSMWWHRIRMPVNVIRLRHDGETCHVQKLIYLFYVPADMCEKVEWRMLDVGRREGVVSGRAEGQSVEIARGGGARTWRGVTCSPIAHMRAVASRPCLFLDIHHPPSISSHELLVRREQQGRSAALQQSLSHQSCS